jgi:uncharacterized membrane protein YeaQ/YmgE (transglycosylase-associated protein family)
MGIIWTIVIGFIAGLIARAVTPGRHEVQGFILTTVLGILGAVVATYVGRELDWYREGEVAGLFGAVVGAVIVLALWGVIARRQS